jgi:flagellar hook-associated protein 1 FlgK
MADLLSILTNGATGLAAHQGAVATASHNIQNANTPGYARQRANLEAMRPAEYVGVGYIGRGVTLQSISQMRDQFVELRFTAAGTAQARSSVESDALASITALDPDGPGSLAGALGAFYSSLRALSQNPGDVGLRQQALATSGGLARAFSGASSSLEAARTGLDAKLTGTVADANQAATTVATLNREIRIARAGGAEPNDLLDARKTAANKLTELTGAAQVETGSGDLQVILAGGGALVSGDKAATLATVADAANGGHLAITLTRADGSGPVTVPGGGFAGAIGGVFDARDGALLSAVNGLDQLAYDFTGAVNLVHAAGFGTDGAGGRNLFVAQAGVAGAASRMAVDPSVAGNPAALAAASSAAGLPGDATNMLALIAGETSAMTGGADVGTTLSGIVAGFGAETARAANMASQDRTVFASAGNQRDSVSSVSIDEEMVSLTKSQQAYDAIARVLTTANQMLDTLMSIAGG